METLNRLYHVLDGYKTVIAINAAIGLAICFRVGVFTPDQVQEEIKALMEYIGLGFTIVLGIIAAIGGGLRSAMTKIESLNKD